MRAVSLPAVSYDATAVRPRWADLPSPLRHAISRRLGAPVTAATSAGGGFTRGFASVLVTATGQRAFVKAAPLDEPPAAWYAREAAVTAALPSEVPAARPRWTMTEAGYFVLCLAAVDGRVPALPWQPAELAATLQAWAVAAQALRDPPAPLLAIGLPRLADLLGAELARWSGIAAGRDPMPPGPPHRLTRLPELAALERALPGHTAGTGVSHGDLRLDNVLIGPGGTAWLCDWTWPSVGPPWFDTVTLLVTGYASGLDVNRLLSEHPTTRGVPADAIDGALAALSGYWLGRAAGRPGTASPHSRGHQRFSGEQALTWLAERRGWA